MLQVCQLLTSFASSGQKGNTQVRQTKRFDRFVLSAAALAMANFVAHLNMLCSVGRSFVHEMMPSHQQDGQLWHNTCVDCKDDSHLHASFSAFIKELTCSISSFLMPSCHQHCPHVCLLSLKPALKTQGVGTTALILDVFVQMLPHRTAFACFDALCTMPLCWQCRIVMLWLMSLFPQNKHQPLYT